MAKLLFKCFLKCKLCILLSHTVYITAGVFLCFIFILARTMTTQQSHSDGAIAPKENNKLGTSTWTKIEKPIDFSFLNIISPKGTWFLYILFLWIQKMLIFGACM